MTRIRLFKSAKYLLATGFVYTLLQPLPSSAQQDISALLTQADEMNIKGEYSAAVELLRPALNANPGNHDLLCSMSDNMTAWARHMPEESRDEKAAKEARYEEALSLARRAVEVDDQQAEGWFQVGQSLGRLALYHGGKTKVNMSKEVKEVFEKALALDPQHPGALHGLARWHREVANLSWILKLAAKIIYGGLPPASNEEAVRLFKEALTVEPDNVNHHLELGKTYLEMKEKDLARQEFETVQQLPAIDFEDTKYKEEAEQLLRKLRR